MHIDNIEFVINDKKLFKEWFINTYNQQFNEKPLVITEIDIKELKEVEKEKEKEQINKYLREVTKVVSVSLFDRDLTNGVLGKGRSQDVILVRKISLYIVCNMLKFSKPYTGEVINKDRTTVLHHCKTINGFLKVDKVFYMKFDQILKTLGEKGLVKYKSKNGVAKIYRNS
jgi:chromosomal replication initiation ATPase DnaA